MTDLSSLSRRERQILEILYTHERATVREIQTHLPDAPSDMAIRRLLGILEEKGHVRRQRQGRENVYAPRVAKQRAAKKALRGVLNTFFGGELERAVAMHLTDKRTEITAEQFDRLQSLIDQARADREQ
jgi:predicted transcriptional regulator